MNAATALRVLAEPVEPQILVVSREAQLRAFLDGETNGEDVLHALFDHVLDEPVPERLRALLNR